MDTPAEETQAPKNFRGFAALHRDVWRIVRISPVVFLVLPVVVWLPIDAVIEFVLVEMELGEWQELRYSLKFDRFAQWIFGSLVLAVQLAAVRIIADGGRPRFGAALRGGLALWARIMGVFFAMAWRVGLATLLLVVPGIYLLVRYSLAYPAAVFEDRQGVAALETSGERVRGSGWKVFFYAAGSLLIYTPILIVPLFFLPPETRPVLDSLAVAPMNAVFTLFPIGMTLLYADRRRDWLPAEPVGQRDATSPAAIEAPVSGRRGVWLVGGLSTATVLIAVSSLFTGATMQILLGDLAYERGDYETALTRYEAAEKADPDDPYIPYSLGWVYRDLDDVESAEACMARAVELDPADPWAVLAHAQFLLETDRLWKADETIRRAESLVGSDEAAVDYLWSLRAYYDELMVARGEFLNAPPTEEE